MIDQAGEHYDLIDLWESDLRPFQYWSGQARLKIEQWEAGEAGGFSTGFTSIDAYSRLNGGDLVVIAARPSQGKTAFAMQIARNVAANLKQSEGRGVVAVFSAEMPGWSLVLRLAAASAGVSVHELSQGRGTPEDYQKLKNAVRDNHTLEIWIDDNSGPTSDQMLDQLSRLNTTMGVRLMVFDFMELSGDSARSENLRLGQIAHNLKAIAKTLDIPVIAISQLNRDVDSRANKIPALSDLRYSGMIEQLADVVLFIVRPEYYVERGLHIDCSPEDKQGIANVYISKNRNGPVGSVRLGFDKERIRFGDLVRVPLSTDLDQPYQRPTRG